MITHVRSIEFAHGHENIVDDMMLARVPQTGEQVSFRFPSREVHRYLVTEVAHTIDVDLSKDVKDPPNHFVECRLQPM